MALNALPEAQAFALETACRWGAMDVVQKLCRNDLKKLLAANDDGEPPVALALRYGHVAVLNMLSDAAVKAVVQKRFASGQRLLHFAARGGSIQACRRLVSCGADPTTRDGRGMTAFHWAALSLQPEALRVLVELTVPGKPHPRDAIDNYGETALHKAAFAGVKGEPSRITRKRATVEALLALGCDPLALNRKGRTPAEVAEEQQDREIAALLQAPEPAIELSANEAVDWGGGGELVGREFAATWSGVALGAHALNAMMVLLLVALWFTMLR
jgi:ankyrin repeat protein